MIRIRKRALIGLPIGWALMLLYLYGSGELTSVGEAVVLVVGALLLLVLVAPLGMLIRRLTRS